jgi:hypothetical protein
MERTAAAVSCAFSVAARSLTTAVFAAFVSRCNYRDSLRITALEVTDRNSLAGIVRAYEAAKVTGVRLIVGCRLDLDDFPSLLVYPTDRKAYARLCRLLTIGKGRAGEGKCQLFWKDVQEWSEGLIASQRRGVKQHGFEMTVGEFLRAVEAVRLTPAQVAELASANPNGADRKLTAADGFSTGRLRAGGARAAADPARI